MRVFAAEGLKVGSSGGAWVLRCGSVRLAAAVSPGLAAGMLQCWRRAVSEQELQAPWAHLSTSIMQAARAKAIVADMTNTKLAGRDYSPESLLLLQEVGTNRQGKRCPRQTAASPCASVCSSLPTPAPGPPNTCTAAWSLTWRCQAPPIGSVPSASSHTGRTCEGASARFWVLQLCPISQALPCAT